MSLNHMRQQERLKTLMWLRVAHSSKPSLSQRSQRLSNVSNKISLDITEKGTQTPGTLHT